MAKNQQHGVLKKLKEEATCPLCLDTFKDPKRLPCDHVYCRECLHGLAMRSLTETISCPQCHTNVQVPNHDVSIFSTSHQVNRLIEIQERNMTVQVAMKKEATCKDHSPQPEDTTCKGNSPQSEASCKDHSSQPEATCKDHNSQPLSLYCDTCQSLVCRDCVITFCSRKNHEYGFIDEMAEKHQKALDKELEPIRELHQQMSSALKKVTVAEKEMQRRKREEIEKINTTFDSLSEILAQERRYCTEAVEKSFQEQSDIHCAKESELSDIVDKIENIIESIEKSSQNESKSSFLAKSANKKQSISQLRKTASIIVPHVEVSSGIKMNLPSPANLKEFCLEKNYYTHSKDPSKAHLDYPVIERFRNVPISQPFEVTLHIDTPKVKALSRRNRLDSTLCCSYTDFSQTVTVKQIIPEKYSLSFVPQKRGNHKLHIKYNDTHICGSPIPIYVTIEPEEIMKVSKPNVLYIMDGICSVKYCEGKICFAQVKNAIYILNTSMNTIIQTIKVPGVSDFLIDQNHIFASDIYQHRLLKMNIDGKIIKAVGKRGYKPGEFNFPSGIRLSKDDKIYVCDSNNNRIQVFDKDLELLTTLGRKGNGNGCFLSPYGLDCDKHGNWYITDQGNCRIQVLTPQGQHIHNIGKKGGGPGELDNPASVAVHRDMIYVTDQDNKRITVFKTTGEFVTIFGENILTRPECIAIDGNGYIFVTDNRYKLAMF